MQYKNTTINVLEGDITSIPTTAIATLINSGGMWRGGLDSAIQSVAGRHYHAEASRILSTQGLHDGQVVVAKGPHSRSWAFQDVIFVIDDLKQQLNDLVFAAVEEAYQRNYESLSLPLMRTGVMKNAVEPVEQVPMLMVNGITRAIYLYERPMVINIVAYRDTALASAVRADLQTLTV